MDKGKLVLTQQESDAVVAMNRRERRRWFKLNTKALKQRQRAVSKIADLVEKEIKIK